MTVLQALDGYYRRMAERGEAEAPGWSREKISFVVVLSPEGEPVYVLDWRQASGKKLAPRLEEVPAGAKRTVAIQPNLLWDKTAYALGRTAGSGKRTAEEHAAFRARHQELLAATEDPGLLALRRFLEAWRPERFDAPPFSAEMLDANVAFRLEGDAVLLHRRDAARRLVGARLGDDPGAARRACLVTGEEAPVRRLHPSIKGVDGAQTAGAALVSFNLEAFASYGQEQGENAPVSEAAAFRYGAALNRLLDRGKNTNRLRLADATVAFWADAAEAEAQAAEEFFASVFGGAGAAEERPDDAPETERVREALLAVRDARPVEAVAPALSPGVRFHALGLSPNAARLSVRFWLSDSFARFAERLARHREDCRIEPAPWRSAPSLARLLVKTTALGEKFDNVPPLLAGEVARAVLEGTPYPRSLLAAAVTRLRAGDDAGRGWHAAAIRAVLAREARITKGKEAPPVALDRDSDDPAYNLGRAFALAEIAQRMALGRGVNATIRDRYYGAASATPASVFPLVLRGMQNHLAKLRKEGKGGWVEREAEEIVGRLPPGGPPRFLPLEGQGRFAIGYYHQRAAKIGGKPAAQLAEEEAIGGDDDNG